MDRLAEWLNRMLLSLKKDCQKILALSAVVPRKRLQISF